MRRTFIGIIALLLSVSWNAQAQKYWTLEECIKYAQERNIQIKRQELIAKTSKNNQIQSKMNMLPSVNAGWNHQLGSGRILTQDSAGVNRYIQMNGNDGSMAVQADLTIFNGFQNYNQIQKSKYDLRKSLADLEKAKNDISLNVAANYLQVLLDEELYAVAKNQTEVTQLQVERTNKLVEVGNLARGNLLEIQAQLAREQVNLTTAANQTIIDYLTLTQILELDSIGDFKVFHPDSLDLDKMSPLQLVNEIYGYAESNMPEVKSSEYLLESQKKSLSIARGRLSPTLNLTGLYSSQYNYSNVTPDIDLSDQLNDKKYKQLSINLTIPIFNRYQNRTNISNSKIAVEDAQYNLLQTKKDLYKSIQQAHADAKAAYDNYISRKESVASSEESFKYTQQKYEVGLANAVDYNIAKTNLSKSKSDLVQSKYEYVFRSKVLDFYKGTKLKL